MKEQFHLGKLTGHGRFCDSRNLPREVKPVGLNDNLSYLVGGGCGGLQNKATPSEGAKRRYEAHFISKLTDCDGLRLGEAYGSESESNETDTSLDFARDCGYITDVEHAEMASQNRSVGRMLGSMIKDPAGFLVSDR